MSSWVSMSPDNGSSTLVNPYINASCLYVSVDVLLDIGSPESIFKAEILQKKDPSYISRSHHLLAYLIMSLANLSTSLDLFN